MARVTADEKHRQAKLNAVFVALGDPTRRAIIEQLADGEARVTDVAEPFAMSLNAVSKHIKFLEEVGLVKRRVAGRDHFLSFDRRPLDDATEWIEKARAFWTGRLDDMERLLKEQDAAKGHKHAK